MRGDDPLRPIHRLIRRLDAIAEFPWEVLAYERWVEDVVRQAKRPTDDYLFSDRVARFVPQDADVLVRSEHLAVRRAGRGSRVEAPQGAAVEVPRIEPPVVERVLAAIDGQRALATIPGAARVERPELMSVLRVLFGVFVFAPDAVQALERSAPGVEITRFPGSPYEIERPYWCNMGAIRRTLGDLEPLALELATNASATCLLRRLHVLALMGDDLATFYKPSSPISAKGATPGAFLTGVAQTLDTAQGTLFLSGPRANVSFIGGETYHRALYAVLDDPDAMTPRSFTDANGLEWGRIVHARAEGDAQGADWFCPPRPLTEAHLEHLFSPLRSAIALALAREHHGVARHLARFHYRFVHLHPFRCANQCVAMALVNHVLTCSHGVGMPHLILDHLALRLAPEPYERVFLNATAAYVLPGVSALDRYRELAQRKARMFAFIERLAAAGSVAAALDEIEKDLESARLALFAA